MRILLIGSKGQLGTQFSKTLKSGKTELGIIDSCLENAVIFEVDVAELDITDISATSEYFKKNNFDIVINCAAYTNVDACETEKEIAFHVNALGPRNLAIMSSTYNFKFVHISTDYVFSGDSLEPYTEWDICNPQSIYGKTKYLGENYVKEFSNKYFIFRTSWLYGYFGNNFVKTIIKLAKEKGELKVVNDQRGNPTNCIDLVHHVIKAMITDQFGIYHCTGNGECSWYDFACKIVEFSRINCKILPCSTSEFPRPAKRPVLSSLDNMMLRCTVGDEMRNWEDALKNYIENLEV